MIGSLEGIVEQKETGIVLVALNGIGYEVFYPKNNESLLPDIGQKIKLYIYHHFTENSQALFGFLSIHQKKVFERLISVSGVGPKTAMTILSDVEPLRLIQAIASGDTAFLSGLHGIGKKTAERLVLDLKDKIRELLPDGDPGTASEMMKSSPIPDAVVQDVTGALSSLGYNPREIKQALGKLQDIKSDASAEEVIRLILKFL